MESNPRPGSMGSHASEPITRRVLFGFWARGSPGSRRVWCGKSPSSTICLNVDSSHGSLSTSVYFVSGAARRGPRNLSNFSYRGSRRIWLRGCRNSCTFWDQSPAPGLMSRMSQPLCFSSVCPMYLRMSSMVILSQTSFVVIIYMFGAQRTA